MSRAAPRAIFEAGSTPESDSRDTYPALAREPKPVKRVSGRRALRTAASVSVRPKATTASNDSAPSWIMT